MEVLINDGWFFAIDKPVDFKPVKLPHDWLIYDTSDLYRDGTGWYKRELTIETLHEGQRVFIRFDGVHMDSTLYVNDHPAGEWKYGYTAFEHEITDFLKADTVNTLLLKVIHQSPNSRWYTGAGIYRDVHLSIKNECRFVYGGINIRTFRQNSKWEYSVDAEVEDNGKAYEVRHTLLHPHVPLKEWDIHAPHLYTMRSELIADGAVADSVDTRFGFREIRFTTGDGFFLNGRRVKLKGVCLHHDLGAFGAAVNKDAIRRQLLILRKMGVNAIRTAHNPPARVFMELCDEMGFLVLSELLDMWKKPKTEYDYARFFDDWIERDVASWIRRDRNSPSVIMWSIGNEIYDTHADADTGGEIMQRLIDLAGRHDPYAHAPVTLCSNYLPWENTQKCMDTVKLAGYNYAENLYDGHHAKYPDWMIYGAETCSTVQSRGIYHFPLSKTMLADDDYQCSSLDNSSTSWGAKSLETCLLGDLNCDYSLGQFIWAGQDYIGEPTPYHTKNSYFGHIDTAGFPKDTYYIIQAAWSDKPMVHLFPYWDFSPGQQIDVRVCSNMPSVELLLNGVSLGVRQLTGRLIADWSIPYQPGVLRAVAYDANNNAAAETERYSFGDPSELVCETETAGGLQFVTVSAVDSDGNRVENANNRVIVTVENGSLLGLDNGDSTDYDRYQGINSKRLFSGKLLAIVQPDPGKEAYITAVFDKSDIPVRKIELISDGMSVSAKIHPENAAYRDLHWRITDAGGIDSRLGEIEVSPDTSAVKVLPKADGEIYIRCGVNNGREHISLYSQIMLTVSGMGKSLTDPYIYVSGGLYSYSNVDLPSGNERGVATGRDGESIICYEDMDFGSYGSDEINIDLFPLGDEPFTFEIWEGLPGKGRHLLDAYYDKGMIWNSYVDETYKLPYRLKGVTTLGLLFRRKVHIKGFLFTKPVKAFERLYASGNDGITGDTFTVTEDAVEKIGNNVTILFTGMDFGERGAECISLCWRSNRLNNSVQVIFECENGEERLMLELPRAGNYTEGSFPLESRVSGKKTVRFLFLPGSEIDLKWIQFIGAD